MSIPCGRTLSGSGLVRCRFGRELGADRRVPRASADYRASHTSVRNRGGRPNGALHSRNYGVRKHRSEQGPWSRYNRDLGRHSHASVALRTSLGSLDEPAHNPPSREVSPGRSREAQRSSIRGGHHSSAGKHVADRRAKRRYGKGVDEHVDHPERDENGARINDRQHFPSRPLESVHRDKRQGEQGERHKSVDHGTEKTELIVGWQRRYTGRGRLNLRHSISSAAVGHVLSRCASTRRFLERSQAYSQLNPAIAVIRVVGSP